MQSNRSYIEKNYLLKLVLELSEVIKILEIFFTHHYYFNRKVKSVERKKGLIKSSKISIELRFKKSRKPFKKTSTDYFFEFFFELTKPPK